MCDSNNKLRKKNKWTSQNIRKSMHYKREPSQHQLVKYEKPDVYTKQIKKYGYQHSYEYDSQVNDNKSVLVDFMDDEEYYLQTEYQFNDFMDDNEEYYNSDSSNSFIYSLPTEIVRMNTVYPPHKYCECNKNQKYLQCHCFNCDKVYCTNCSESKLYPWMEEFHTYSICKNCYIQWEEYSIFTAIGQSICDIISSNDIINLIYSYCGSFYMVNCVNKCKCKNEIYIKSYYQIIDLERLFSHKFSRYWQQPQHTHIIISDAYNDKDMTINYKFIALCCECYNCNKYDCECSIHGSGVDCIIFNAISGSCEICKRLYEYCNLLEKCKSCGIEYDNPNFRFKVRCNTYITYNYHNLTSQCLNCGWRYGIIHNKNIKNIKNNKNIKNIKNNKNIKNIKNINLFVQHYKYEYENVLNNKIDANHNIKEYSISKWRYRGKKRTKR